MGKTDMKADDDNQAHKKGDVTHDQQRPGTSSDPHQTNPLEQEKSWAMEVYKGEVQGQNKENLEDDGMLQFDLDEEETALGSKVMAIVVYYSHKRYSPHVMFADMVKAWNVHQLANIEKIGDYIFKVEFTMSEEKTRVLEGGSGAIREMLLSW
jgi:hypothetical protein